MLESMGEDRMSELLTALSVFGGLLAYCSLACLVGRELRDGAVDLPVAAGGTGGVSASDSCAAASKCIARSADS